MILKKILKILYQLNFIKEKKIVVRIQFLKVEKIKRSLMM